MTVARPGDSVMYCGQVCKVSSIYHGRADLTDERGTVIASDIPVAVLHKVARMREPTYDERRILKEIVRRRQ